MKRFIGGDQNRAVAIWLFTCAALVFAMVVVGGITRLTGSGLSITEWKPIMGALPPMNSTDWNEAFEKYRAIPILVLTTESDAEKKNRARQAGATGWIVKPFDPTKLIDAIERVTA